MKMLLMTEAEFEAALRTRVRAVTYVCNYDGDIYEELQEEMTQAEAACRARPVPEWATYFADVSDESGSHQLVRYVRIKK